MKRDEQQRCGGRLNNRKYPHKNTANNKGQTRRSAPTITRDDNANRRGGPMCPPKKNREHTIHPLRNSVARPPKTGGQYVNREQ